MRQRLLAVAGLAALGFCGGCWNPPGPAARQVERGLVWMLPGVEGRPWSVYWARAAFRDAGVESEIHILDWRRPFGTLRNLRDYEGNRRKATEIAEEIAGYRQEHPDGPIDLVRYVAPYLLGE